MSDYYDHNDDDNEDEEFNDRDDSEEYSEDNDYGEPEILVIINGKFLFKLVSYTPPKVIYNVYLLRSDKPEYGCVEFYNDVMKSDELDFKLSVGTGMIIVKKSGFMVVNDDDAHAVVEYTITTPEGLLDNMDDLAETISDTFEPLYCPKYIGMQSESMIKCYPVSQVYDIRKIYYLYNTQITIEDETSMIELANSNWLYNIIKEADDKAKSDIVHYGVTEVEFNKSHLVEFTNNTVNVTTKFTINKINGLKVLSLTPSTITIEYADDMPADAIRLMVADCFSNTKEVVSVTNIKLVQTVTGPDKTKYVMYQFDTNTFSLDRKPKKGFFYNKRIVNDESIAIYKSTKLFANPHYFGFMSVEMYNEIVDKDNDKVTRMELILDSVPELKRINPKIFFRKKSGNVVYFTIK